MTPTATWLVPTKPSSSRQTTETTNHRPDKPEGEQMTRTRSRAMTHAPAARMRLILAVALLAIGASPAIARAESSQISVGPIQTLAHVPYPGNPGAATLD